MQLSAKGADAEVTKDSIVEALGYEPEEVEGKYELINSITTTEAATAFKFTTDSSGNAFKLKHAVLIFKSSSTVTTAVNGSVYFRTAGDTALASGYFIKVFTGHNGLSYFWINIFGSRIQGFYESFNQYNTISENTNLCMKHMNGVAIAKADGSFTAGIPVGATISLYGIRAT